MDNTQTANTERVYAIVMAAGSGTRMGAQEKKPFLSLGGRPMLVYSLQTLSRHEEITDLLVVTSSENVERVKLLIDQYQVVKARDVVAGGQERQDSVRLGLSWIQRQARQPAYVLVHDAARPFVSNEGIRNVLAAARRSRAATLAVSVKDTIKRIERRDETAVQEGRGGLYVAETLDRSHLVQTQTPQAFQWELIWRAHQAAVASGYTGTDDAGLVEWIGESVEIAIGEYENFKVTTPDDLWMAEALLKDKKVSLSLPSAVEKSDRRT